MIRNYGNDFLPLEERAGKEGIFMDYEVTASSNRFGVKCTVSDGDGKRAVRMASDADLSNAQEHAGYMALCAYYGEKANVPERKEEPSAPATDERKERQQAGNRNQGKGQSGIQKQDRQEKRKTQDTGRVLPEKDDTKTRAGTQQEAGPREETPKPAEPATEDGAGNGTPVRPEGGTAAKPGKRDPDDFELSMPVFKKEPSRFISDLLKTPSGREGLKRVMGINMEGKEKSPAYNDVARAKAYMAEHGVTFGEA